MSKPKQKKTPNLSEAHRMITDQVKGAIKFSG